MLIVLLLMAFAAPIASAQSVTRQIQFFPAFSEGSLVGCQIGFSVVRFDTEFSQGEPVLVNGLVVFYGEQSGHAGAMLRLGVAPADRPNEFTPVARAYLLDGLRTNASETGTSFLSDDVGFRVFPFALGEVTANAIGRSFTERRFRVSYGLPNTRVDAPFEINLGEHPTEAAQWEQCMDTVISP